MPKELIFTSAPTGLKPGSSGYCTVARHEDMTNELERELEQISFFEINKGINPVIHAFRVLNLRTGPCFVLSCIRYSGSDHTGRTNYLAHHLTFDEREIYAMGNLSPADFLKDGSGWMTEWPKDARPKFFQDGQGEKEKTGLRPAAPAENANSTWQQLTGDGLNAYCPFHRPSQQSRFLTAQGEHYQMLQLMSEFAAQSEVNMNLVWRTFTFTTFLQRADNPNDFKCLGGTRQTAAGSVTRDTIFLDQTPQNCFQAQADAAPRAMTVEHVSLQPKEDEPDPSATVDQPAAAEGTVAAAAAPESGAKARPNFKQDPGRPAEPQGVPGPVEMPPDPSMSPFSPEPPDPVTASGGKKWAIIAIAATVALLIGGALYVFWPKLFPDQPEPKIAAKSDDEKPGTGPAEKTGGGGGNNPGDKQAPDNKELNDFMADAKDLEEKIDDAGTDAKALAGLESSVQELKDAAKKISGAEGSEAKARANQLASKLADKLDQAPIEVMLTVEIAPPAAQTAGCSVSEGGELAFDSSKPRKSGENIELKAVPGQDWEFVSWSHGGKNESTTYKLPREKSASITANFKRKISNLLALKDFPPSEKNLIVFADGFGKPIEFAPMSREIPFSGNPEKNPSAQFSWRASGAELAFEAGNVDYKSASSSGDKMRFENEGQGFTLDLSRKTLDLGDLKPRAGEAFKVEFARGFDVAFSLVVFDLNSLRKNKQIVQLEGIPVGLAPSKSAGFDKVCTFPTEGIYAKDGKWISGSYDPGELKKNLTSFHDLLNKQPSAIIEEKLMGHPKADFVYLKGLAGNVKAQQTPTIRYFDQGRANSLLNEMATIIEMHTKHNPKAHELKDKVLKFENRLGAKPRKGQSYPRILAAIKNYFDKNGINAPAFFNNEESIKGKDSRNFINMVLAQIDGMQVTHISDKQKGEFATALKKKRDEITDFENGAVRRPKKKSIREVFPKRANFPPDIQKKYDEYLRAHENQIKGLEEGKKREFKKRFPGVPYDNRDRAKHFTNLKDKQYKDHIDTKKDKLKEALKLFDGIDWAAVPIGAPELWAKETASDLKKALKTLKDTLNMAAVPDLEGQATAPAPWEFRVGNHSCLKLK